MALPVHNAIRPSELVGQKNGQLDPAILHEVEGGYLLRIPGIAWKLMVAHAKRDGITLVPTSSVDTYRPLATQDSVFRRRYDHTPRRNTGGVKWYKGLPWWKKPDVATAAVPGTSNHGWAIAVDVANATGKVLDWLLKNAWTYGFSWELQSEPWHLRYCLGDHLPAVTIPALPSLPQPNLPLPLPLEEEDMLTAIRAKGDSAIYLTDGYHKWHVDNGDSFAQMCWIKSVRFERRDDAGFYVPFEVAPEYVAWLKPGS